LYIKLLNRSWCYTEKNGFVTATKLGTTNNFFVAANTNFAAATKRFVDRTIHFVLVTRYFCYPYFNKNDFVGITKPFIPCMIVECVRPIMSLHIPPKQFFARV